MNLSATTTEAMNLARFSNKGVECAPFDVLMPDELGNAVVAAQVMAGVKWDDEIGEFLLTQKGHRDIEQKKAELLGFDNPQDCMAFREIQRQVE